MSFIYYNDCHVQKTEFINDKYQMPGTDVYVVIYTKDENTNTIEHYPTCFDRRTCPSQGYVPDEKRHRGDIILVSMEGEEFLFPPNIANGSETIANICQQHKESGIPRCPTCELASDLRLLWARRGQKYTLEEVRSADSITSRLGEEEEKRIVAMCRRLDISKVELPMEIVEEEWDESVQRPLIAPHSPTPELPSDTPLTDMTLGHSPPNTDNTQTRELGHDSSEPEATRAKQKHRKKIWDSTEYENPLFLNGYQYQANSATDRGIYYVCASRNTYASRQDRANQCKASVVLDLTLGQYRVINHNHTCDRVMINQDQNERRLRLHKIVSSLSSQLTYQQVEAEVLQIEQREKTKLLVSKTDITYLRNLVYRSDRRVHGNLAQSRLPEKYWSLNQEPFIVWQGNIPPVLLFMLPSSSRWQNLSDEIMIVGREGIQLPEGFHNLYVGFTIRESARPCFWLVTNKTDSKLWKLTFAHLAHQVKLDLSKIKVVTYDYMISMSGIPNAISESLDVASIRTTSVSYKHEVQTLLSRYEITDEDAQELLDLDSMNIVVFEQIKTKLQKKKREKQKQFLNDLNKLTEYRENVFLHAASDPMRCRIARWIRELVIPSDFDSFMNQICDFQLNLEIREDGT